MYTPLRRGCQKAALFYTAGVRTLPPQLAESIRRGGRGLSLLVIRFGALGDILRTLPAVRLVRSGLPRARIAWAMDQQWGPMVQDHPDLDAIVPFPRSRWDELTRSVLRWPRLVPALLAWRRRLRLLGVDLVLDFHGNLRSGLSGLLSGAPTRLGYEGHHQKEGNRVLSTHRIPSGARRTSRIERNLDLVRALGLPPDPLPDGGLVIPDEAAQRARRIAAEEPAGRDGRYAVIAPGVSRRQAFKKPPAELLAAAAQRLSVRGILPIVVHGPGELDDAERVVQSTSGIARLAPPTDLKVLAALVRGAELFVGGDTGPLHLACAVGCPVVALYGPTDPKVNTPWRVPHAAVAPPGRRYTGISRQDRLRGFEGLTASLVGSAVDGVLSESASRRATSEL